MAELSQADEIGSPADAFNQMLAQIEKRDEDLRASEQRLKDILDNSTAVVYLKDKDGRYILVNRWFEALFHVSQVQLVGKTDYDLFPQERADAFRANDLKVLAAAAPLQFEEVAPHCDGLHTYISIKFPLFDAAGVLYAVCGISTDISERKRLEKQILEIGDREQARIGQDLHDDLCQRLVCVAFASNLLEQELAAGSPAQAERAHKISELLDEAITQARSIAGGLFPVNVDTGGLSSALQELCTKVNSASGIRCEFSNGVPVSVGHGSVATHLYRIAQEAVNNAVKHASPTRIAVEIGDTEKTVSLTIHDNGTGIRQGREESGGMGFHIMKYRARMIGATLEITSPTEGGTIVCCSLPRESLE